MMQKELDKKKSLNTIGDLMLRHFPKCHVQFRRDRKVQDGASLLIVDGVVHDVETFVDKRSCRSKHTEDSHTQTHTHTILQRWYLQPFLRCSTVAVNRHRVTSIRGVMCVCVSCVLLLYMLLYS